MRIGGNIGYSAVQVPRVTSPDQPVTIGVQFVVENPSGIGLVLTQISYQFYMDNLTDTRDFVEKEASIRVTRGGYFPQANPATVPARSTGMIWVNTTVEGDALSRLNLTFNGLYFPIVIADFVYRIEGTTILDRLVGIVFSTSRGVEPHEG